MSQDHFGARRTLKTRGGEVAYYSLPALSQGGVGQIDKLPYSIRVLVEGVLRQVDNYAVHPEDVTRLANWQAVQKERPEMPFKPSRVVLQDFTGVPALVDLAALRSAMARLGGDPAKINPTVRVDLVIDHSVQVDVFGTPKAIQINADFEFERNRERYEFLKWGQEAFDRFRVVPPATGIVHQVNLEFLADVISAMPENGGRVALPDTLVGTDSHTTMINGLGVLGWGVGGIEAEAVMLGQPIYMLTPEVVGFELTGRLPEGSTATDLVLVVTQMLRARGVVDKFVEFYGQGMDSLSLPDRATIANMAPEYGATMGYFPVDAITLKYMRLTGRSEDQIDLVERYCKEQGLWRDDGVTLEYSDKLSLDLATVEPSLAGPKRPQDRMALSQVKQSFEKSLTQPAGPKGFGLTSEQLGASARVGGDAAQEIQHGAVVISAITSCTNTSNPSVLIAAGLLAKKAVARGLRTKPWVKTSLAPGSRVVTDYLDASGLSAALDELGFQTVGYGCTTCIGNSGPLPEDVSEAITQGDIVAAAVLSGNRNFEGRINPQTRANYLASPPLVVAYALAGTVDIDLATEPIGRGSDGTDVYLRDIWPGTAEINDVIAQVVGPEAFRSRYGNVFDGNPTWNAIPSRAEAIYPWDASSTYIQEPPFFQEMTREVHPIRGFEDARVLLLLGDSVTTDHISPAGSISVKSPAGQYLIEHGVQKADFNSYGARRGNDRVMTRGTFANIRVRNLLVPGVEGGVSQHLPSGEVASVYDVSLKYKASGTPLVVIAGKDYGMGSSRDWAAKGTLLLGARAVLAESYERIHRSNLVQMGVAPLQFKPGENAQTHGLTGREYYSLALDDSIEPRQIVALHVRSEDGSTKTIEAVLRIDSRVEIDYFRNGGILQTVLRSML